MMIGRGSGGNGNNDARELMSIDYTFNTVLYIHAHQYKFIFIEDLCVGTKPGTPSFVYYIFLYFIIIIKWMRMENLHNTSYTYGD